MSQSPANDLPKSLIVVVDDDVSFLRSVARLLQAAGYAVATFSAAREFLAALPGLAPRCLVLDVHMPEMTGFELQEHVKAQGRCPPTIFVTANDTPQTRAQARQAGNLGLLLKPFDQQELLNAISVVTH